MFKFQMQKLIFESYTPFDIEPDNPCYSTSLGFKNSLASLSGYDPMFISTIFSGTQQISNALGMMPWEIKSYTNNEEPSNNHWFYHLFDNCLQTQFMFTKNLIKDVIVEGNGYAYIQRENNKPVKLIYLPAGTCAPQLDVRTFSLYYNVNYMNLQKRCEPKDIIHVFVNSKDGLIGESLFYYAKKTIDLSAYTEKAAADYFGSGMRYTGILSTDAPRLKDDQRREIRNNYLSGINSENGIAVLEAGMRFEQLSNNAKDAQLIDSRQYNVQEAGRYFIMAPTKFGDFSHNIYGTIEAGSISFITDACGPYTINLEQELTRKLLTPTERKKYYISLNQDVLIKSDRTTYANYVKTLYEVGIMSKGEGRALLGLPEVEDSDEFVIPYQGTTKNASYNNRNQTDNDDKNIDTQNNETD